MRALRQGLATLLALCLAVGPAWADTDIIARGMAARAQATADAAGGGAAGLSTQVQYNAAGGFAGDAGLTYDAASDTLTAGALTLTTPLAVAQGGTGATTSTGSGAAVLANTPTLVTPNIGAATGASLSVSGQLTSTVATGTAPLVVSSTTNVANLNASSLGGATFSAPGAIGGGTPGSGAFTTLTTTSTIGASGVVTAPSYVVGSATKLVTGTGSPESAQTAPVGSLFLRTDGGANTTLYRKESGAGNTGWVAVSNAGAGSAAGSDTQVQFNDGTAFGGDAGLTYNKTTDTLTAGALTLTTPLAVAQGGTGATTSTGSGATVLASSPTLVTPVLGAATGTSLSVSGQLTSTVATGTAPLVVSSTTNVANLNASSLGGATFAAPGAIGGGTPGSGAFTTLTTTSTIGASGVVTAPSYVVGSATKLVTGAGSPESVVTAPVGSLYLRTDGAAGTTLYEKATGTGNTGWVANGTGSGGGGTPGGSDTQIQFNDGGSFGGDAGLVYNKTTDALTLAGALAVTGVVSQGTPTAALTTIAPGSNVISMGGAAAAGLGLESTRTSSSSSGPILALYENDGAAMASGDRLGAILYGGASSASALRNTASISAYAAQTWSDGTAYGSRLVFENTANNAANASERLAIEQSGLVTFGGATSSFPALKRSAAALAVRLGDDSANAALTVGGLTNSAGEVVAIRVVTGAGAVTVTTADYIVSINKSSGAATTVNLPGSPVTGQTFVIKDGKGDAFTNNITITPAAGNIDGAATLVMNVNRQSVNVTYNGTEWTAW